MQYYKLHGTIYTAQARCELMKKKLDVIEETRSLPTERKKMTEEREGKQKEHSILSDII